MKELGWPLSNCFAFGSDYNFHAAGFSVCQGSDPSGVSHARCPASYSPTAGVKRRDLPSLESQLVCRRSPIVGFQLWTHIDRRLPQSRHEACLRIARQLSRSSKSGAVIDFLDHQQPGLKSILELLLVLENHAVVFGQIDEPSHLVDRCLILKPDLGDCIIAVIDRISLRLGIPSAT